MDRNCSYCGRVWALEAKEGKCQWCGKTAFAKANNRLRGDKANHSRRRKEHKESGNGYGQLDGDWKDWLAVAKKYEGKVLAQDREDIRHDILIELARARDRDNKPLPPLRAYRIASLTVALYWRQANRANIRVCVYFGIATEANNQACNWSDKPSKCSKCPFLALRPAQSLEGDNQGLRDTIADDKAIDLDQWLDDRTWLLGFPMRLIEIAQKRVSGKLLDAKDKMYLQRFRKKEQKKLI